MPLYRAELLAKKPLRYAALIHDVSQVLRLPFDYDDGSYARDRSGYGNHGTIYGAARADGKIGMALSFDGVDDYVEIPYSSSLVTSNEMTIEAWVKRDPTAPPFSTILTALEWAESYRLWARDTGLYYVFTIEGTRTEGAWPIASIDNRFVHIVITFASGIVKGYRNGVLVGTADHTSTGTTLTALTNPVQISGRFYPDEYWKGLIDEVRIYNVALSQDEIRMLMYRRLV